MLHFANTYHVKHFLEEMLSLQNPRQTPTPPELRFLKEDVGPEDYNPGVSHYHFHNNKLYFHFSTLIAPVDKYVIHARPCVHARR